MTETESGAVETGHKLDRVIGRLRGDETGPTLLALGGIHGNEPAGVAAAGRVCDRLRRHPAPLRGEFVALAGNLRALDVRTRYLEKDLNRQWSSDNVARLSRSRRSDLESPDDVEQLDLLAAVDEVVRGAPGPIYFLDLHTFSAPGSPFVTVGDTLYNRAFAQAFPLPLILGLEEQVDGALLEHLNNLGVITAGAEGGQHDDPASVDHLEAVLWIALVATGLLRETDLPDLERFRSRLERASSGAPRVVEVRYRHPVRPGDGFRMEPGFTNFKPVEAGRIVARDADREIRAREAGVVVLPLYQGKGDDGFFVAREVRPLWLRVSSVLRHFRVGVLAPVFPGVRRHPGRPGTLVVNTRVARFFPMDVMHLLGYRKIRERGSVLLVERRRFDVRPPSPSARRRALDSVWARTSFESSPGAGSGSASE